MKKVFPLLSILLISFYAWPQEDVTKTGWNFGALPTITFDTDLGFQYGALVNLYNYGDGSRYPNYDHSLYFEVSRFTKGSGINRFYYDSDKLIEGMQTSVDISYFSDQAYDFYGFNGYDAVVNPGWIDDQTKEYKSRMFYKYDRKLFRFKVDLQGNFLQSNFRWAAGINLLNFSVGSVDIDKLNDGKDDAEKLPPLAEQPGLYEKYRDGWNIIPEDEADGGFVPTLKAGLVYDTRDNKPNPMKGVWTEAVLVGAPEFLGAESGFVKFNLTHRQYFTLVPKNLSLVYRLAYQTTVAGHTPFYYQTQVITSVLKGASSEGLGGAKSLRGIRRNRIVGDGFFFGNVEARWKFARFQFINNNFYLGLNGFVDFGQVTDKINVERENRITTLVLHPGYESIDEYFDVGAESMHFSYGAGLRIAMNQNFVIAVDYGFAADERDGDSGLYIGLNYLF
jgi:hypothetical protein